MKISIKDILAKESMEFPEEGEHLEFTGRDGQIVAVPYEELINAEVYVEEEKGLYRLVIPGDVHRRRWCKDIVEIRKVSDS